jgi:hypothetical protein
MPVTRAKNATQHPGRIVIDAQQTRRGPEDMAKVRAQERLNRRLTEKRTRTALKSVARIQDRLHAQDMAQHPVLAPSLRRHETLLVPGPTDPSVADKDQWSDGSDFAAALSGEGDTDRDEDLDHEDSQAGTDTMSEDDIQEEATRQRRKKAKKKGDGMRDLIEKMRKHPLGATKKETILVTQAAPAPAPKGKKPRARPLAAYVFTSSHPLCHLTDKLSSPIIHHWHPLNGS